MIYKVATVIYNGPVKMLDQKNGGGKKKKMTLYVLGPFS